QERLQIGLAGGVAHLVAAALEGAAEGARKRRIVLDDQQAARAGGRGVGGRGVGGRGAGGRGVHGCGAGARASRASEDSGSSSTTSAPRGLRLAACRRPPKLRATLSERNSPRPPPGRPLLEL